MLSCTLSPIGTFYVFNFNILFLYAFFPGSEGFNNYSKILFVFMSGYVSRTQLIWMLGYIFLVTAYIPVIVYVSKWINRI